MYRINITNHTFNCDKFGDRFKFSALNMTKHIFNDIFLIYVGKIGPYLSRKDVMQTWQIHKNRKMHTNGIQGFDFQFFLSKSL